MSLLRNTRPLVVDPDLAEMIGLNEALILQQVHYWINNREEVGINYHDGRYWVYNTISNWQKRNFRFLSEATIKRTFKALRSMGIIITAFYNDNTHNRTLWYSIDYDRLEELEKNSSGRTAKPSIPLLKKF
jgi:hypothetical protein